MIRLRRLHRSHLAVLAAVVAVACGGCGSSDIAEILFGGLRVDTVTTGANPDPNDYILQITGPSLNVEDSIGLNDQAVFAATPGNYSVLLSDIAANCTLGLNPVNVFVNIGLTLQVSFDIECP